MKYRRNYRIIFGITGLIVMIILNFVLNHVSTVSRIKRDVHAIEAFEKELPLQQFTMSLKNLNISYLMTIPDEKFNCKNLKMFVGIMSTGDPEGRKLRDAMRNAFLRKATASGITYRFFIGYRPTLFPRLLALEMARHNDIVYIDTVDSYQNNTLKWNAVYEWHQRYCPEPPYFMKMDHDVTVHFPRLFEWINIDFAGRTSGLEDWLVCQKIEGVQPIRDINSKWFVPAEEFNGDWYPPYCNGYALITPTGTITKLHRESRQHVFLRIDDVFFTGIASEPLNISIIDFPGIRNGVETAQCLYDLPESITTHGGHRPEDVFRDYARLSNCGSFDENSFKMLKDWLA